MTAFRSLAAAPLHGGLGLTAVGAAVFLLIHIPLGLVIQSYPILSTAHAFVVFTLGLFLSFTNRERHVAVWGAYVTGSEVLWRMTGAAVPWEAAKYALTLVFALAIFRSGRFRAPALPLTYMALLIPSTVLVASEAAMEELPNAIRFNLSGPLALAVGVWFFSRLKLMASDYAAALVAIMAAMIGVASIILSAMFVATSLTFTNASNFATSGGFGPNQVSSMLGLGALLSVLLLLTIRGPRWFRVSVFLLAIGFASQSALTFSRGGVYTAGAAMAATVPFMVRDRARRRRLLVGGSVALVIGAVVVRPALESLTEGALGSRFQDVDLTGRDLIMKADLAIWAENPILGVGPGMAPTNRLYFLGTTPAAHTEWTRLLAEHGVLGVGAILCLLAMARRALASDRSGFEKGFNAALIVWAFLFMFHAAMRLAAPAFAMGLAQCRIGGSTRQPKEARR